MKTFDFTHNYDLAVGIIRSFRIDFINANEVGLTFQVEDSEYEIPYGGYIKMKDVPRLRKILGAKASEDIIGKEVAFTYIPETGFIAAIGNPKTNHMVKCI